MFEIKVPLDLTLIPKGEYDSSKHSLKMHIDSEILKQLAKEEGDSPHYIKFKNVTLGLSKTVLSNFSITHEIQEEECIPVIINRNLGQQTQLLQSNILTFKLCLVIDPQKKQATMNTVHDILKFTVSAIEQIKMSHNHKLKSILQKPSTLHDLEYGFLTMDRRKRVIVSEVETSYPIVGMWVYGEQICLDSMYVYDLLYKFITSPLEKKCNIMVGAETQQTDINFIFQIYRSKRTQSYLLSLAGCQPERISETIFYKTSEQLEFGNAEMSCMQFTLRDKTMMNTFDLYSPIKILRDRQGYEQNSPEFTKLEQPNNHGSQIVERLKTQQSEIQSLKYELQKYRNLVKTLQTKTPQKMRLIGSPGCSSIGRTMRSDKLKESDLKVFTSSKQKSRNSKQSTSAKNSIEIQDFQKVRNFLFEEHQRRNEVETRINSARNYQHEIWDNIHIIQQQSYK